MKKLLLATTLLCALSSGAYAAIIDHGVTYSVTSSGLNTSTADFTIHITGINSASDDEGGRTGINAFAFSTNSLLPNLLGTSMFGTFHTGGLNASGCNGSGGFFCFAAFLPPSTTTADSTIDIKFSLTLLSGNFLAWANSDPDFKIDWTGTKNNYDVVSKTGTGICPDCTPTQVPGPVVGALVPSMAAAFGMLGFNYWRRRRFA